MSTPSRTAGAPKPSARLVVALGVVALLLGDVWRLPHLLLARHVVCREHGELVHEHENAVQRAPGEGSAGTAKAAPASGAEHEHEHCSSLATASRSAAVIALPAAAAQSLGVPGVRELAWRELPACRPTHVLGFAPKQGPPV